MFLFLEEQVQSIRRKHAILSLISYIAFVHALSNVLFLKSDIFQHETNMYVSRSCQSKYVLSRLDCEVLNIL